jgi:hypothetical protein
MDEETALLLGFLDGERKHVLGILEGFSEEQLTPPCLGCVFPWPRLLGLVCPRPQTPTPTPTPWLRAQASVGRAGGGARSDPSAIRTGGAGR